MRTNKNNNPDWQKATKDYGLGIINGSFVNHHEDDFTSCVVDNVTKAPITIVVRAVGAVFAVSVTKASAGGRVKLKDGTIDFVYSLQVSIYWRQVVSKGTEMVADCVTPAEPSMDISTKTTNHFPSYLYGIATGVNVGWD